MNDLSRMEKKLIKYKGMAFDTLCPHNRLFRKKCCGESTERRTRKEEEKDQSQELIRKIKIRKHRNTLYTCTSTPERPKSRKWPTEDGMRRRKDRGMNLN